MDSSERRDQDRLSREGTKIRSSYMDRDETKGRLFNQETLFPHDELTAVFDALLRIPGLGGGMMISTLHTVLATQCHDEIIRYLTHIRDVWVPLFQGNTGAMLLVDQASVEAVELKAPQTSTVDANVLQGQIQGGIIFSAFSSQARADIWLRLKAIKGLIPLLSTFLRGRED